MNGLGIDLDRLRAHMAVVVAKQWGERVRRRRRDLDLTLQQVADLIGEGFPVQTLSKIERGEIAPRDYLRGALALCLASDVDELFPMPDRSELKVAAS